MCTVCTKYAQNPLSVHSRRELCAVCTVCEKMQNMHLVCTKWCWFWKHWFFVHTWAKSRPSYPGPLPVGSGSLRRAVDRLAVLTLPVGRSGDRWLGVLQHVATSRQQQRGQFVWMLSSLPVNHCCPKTPNSCSSPALNHSTLRVRAILHLVMSTALKRSCPPKLHTKIIRNLKQHKKFTDVNTIIFAFSDVSVMY